ncbi:MAG TPA: hypothetical protein VKS01_10210 [Bryobacteraceae bacterium]|nr:hypothetical protein [Bryobacteraceae bacterium]
MAQKATAISISKLSAAVNTAVASAGKRFPTIPIPPPNEVCYYPHLILGFPVPEPIAQAIEKESIANLNAFAGEVAGHLGQFAEGGGGAATPAPGGGSLGAVYSFGGHIIMGRWISPPTVAAIRD